MGKKNKTPFAIRVVRWLFPKMEAIAPSLAHRYFIHIFFTPFHYGEPEKEKELLKSSTKFHVMLDITRVQCYRWGNAGPKVMLVHGWAGRAGQFRAMIPVLVTAGFQVIAFDGPAHGRSEGKQTNLAEFGSVMQKLIDSEGEFTGIIGHSFGGIAALYAITNNLRITKLITISSPMLSTQVINNFRNAINASPEVGPALDKYLKKKYGKSFEEFTGVYCVKHLPGPLDLLVIQDENDPEVSVENAIELKKAYPPATIHFTKGLGHTRILRDDAVISACLKFMES